MCPSQIVCQSANTDPTVPPKDRPTRHISNCDYRAPGKGRSVRRSANLGGSVGATVSSIVTVASMMRSSKSLWTIGQVEGRSDETSQQAEALPL